MWHSNDVFHYNTFIAEFVMLVSLTVPSGSILTHVVVDRHRKLGTPSHYTLGKTKTKYVILLYTVLLCVIG